MIACQAILGHLHPGIKRRIKMGRRDLGDIEGIPGVTIEVKNSVIRMAESVREAEVEGQNAGTIDRWFLFARIPRMMVARWYAITHVYVILDMLKVLEEQRREISRLSTENDTLRGRERVHQDRT